MFYSFEPAGKRAFDAAFAAGEAVRMGRESRATPKQAVIGTGFTRESVADPYADTGRGGELRYWVAVPGSATPVGPAEYLHRLQTMGFRCTACGETFTADSLGEALQDRDAHAAEHAAVAASGAGVAASEVDDDVDPEIARREAVAERMLGRAIYRWEDHGVLSGLVLHRGHTRATLVEGSSVTVLDLTEIATVDPANARVLDDGIRDGVQTHPRLAIDLDSFTWTNVWWFGDVSYAAEETEDRWVPVDADIDPDGLMHECVDCGEDADTCDCNGEGFALDADGVSDVTPGEQIARAVATGEPTSFPARLGVRYEHEHLAYWVSVEDCEGNENGLWVEAGEFLAMCRRMLGG
ncbi:hypothetical protein QE418_003402 [Microbacterium testaceum]|uniref:hypothetical protein n=1 Tax=Microbacterium TaxID=33882 RepID=UPI002789023B|nr:MULTISPECIES: hypothetical protein [Microbacterium]MDQ1113954.1 hypothetical protein [Microbacterium testaceum]MDR6098940.1 hypothetical protein [Microbacterium sp. SORGH_AS_0454]